MTSAPNNLQGVLDSVLDSAFDSAMASVQASQGASPCARLVGAGAEGAPSKWLSHLTKGEL